MVDGGLSPEIGKADYCGTILIANMSLGLAPHSKLAFW